MAPPKYLEAAKKACQRRNDALAAFYQPPEWDESKLPANLTEYSLDSGYYSSEELKIIQTSARDILVNIAQKEWTSLAVTQAFCKAAALAQKLTNCLTEVLFKEAFETARTLDEHLELTGSIVGPLHGLPISLKDCFIIAPYPASIGLAALANQPQNNDTVLVSILRELGAVLYAKTNVPTSMLMTETTNCIWGECRNPLQKLLSPGGSSGGEAALIAFHGSPLGVGTDLGGSIRTPAAWCYLYGLKPSVGRFPSWGGMSGIPGQEFVPAVSGPMARDLDSLRLFCETILSPAAAPWRKDPKCLPMEWKTSVLKQGTKLRVGLIGRHDGVVHCHPPVERALGLVKTALEAQGHEVVDWRVDDHGEILRTLQLGLSTLSGTTVADMLEEWDEPLLPSMGSFKASPERRIVQATVVGSNNLKKGELQKSYLERMASIDCIIQAVSPFAAARLGATQERFYVGYTAVWNLLDLPVCTFPVTMADRDLDKARDLSQFQYLNDLDSKVQAEYDPDIYHGAPVSLQIVGKRLEEEKVLDMVDVVAKALKQY